MAATDVLISEQMVRKCFEGPWDRDAFEIVQCEGKPHQAAVYRRIMLRVFPRYDQIKSIDGWPAVSKKTNSVICQHFILFDQAYHRHPKPGELKTMAGGLWMNNGFATKYDLEDWLVDLSDCTIHYIGENDNG